jgi:hypothetical protein
MPKESFYSQADVDASRDGTLAGQELMSRGLHVSWGNEDQFVSVGNVEMGWAGINRLIKTLRKARDQRYGAPE